MTQHIIITGNPVDGFNFFGAFESSEDAIRAAENLDPDWWVAPLIPGEEISQ